MCNFSKNVQSDEIKIRPAIEQEFERLSQIWFEVSLICHDFIPANYWASIKNDILHKYLPKSEVYVAEESNEIYGFVALLENHIGAIFVDSKNQGQGIGSLLISHIKKLRQELTLNVYEKNEKSINFYKSKGFEILKETIDEPNNENQFVMIWKSNSSE